MVWICMHPLHWRRVVMVKLVFLHGAHGSIVLHRNQILAIFSLVCRFTRARLRLIPNVLALLTRLDDFHSKSPLLRRLHCHVLKQSLRLSPVMFMGTETLLLYPMLRSQHPFKCPMHKVQPFLHIRFPSPWQYHHVMALALHLSTHSKPKACPVR